MIRNWIAAIGLALLCACHKAPAPPPTPKVALWAISGPGKTGGWILGTVHSLPPSTVWRRPAIDAAMASADRLIMEIGEPIDATIAGKALTRLAMTPGLPPPTARLDPAGAKALLAAYQYLDLSDEKFHDEESWAVALQISAISSQKEGADAQDGVEPQLRKRMAGKPVAGLETVDSQFAIFDGLEPRAQNKLLADVAREATAHIDTDADMLAMWLKGDDMGLAREANSDFLADPALHEALLTGRNRAWTGQIDSLLRSGAHPFIAVGAAHISGRDGLPDMLRAKGWTVKRVY